MTTSTTPKILTAALTRINEDKVVELAQRSLDRGVHPHLIMEQMRAGLDAVYQLYSKGTYFLADLLIAAEIFKKVQNMVQDQTRLTDRREATDIVFGTVKDDIHDIGKNIVISVMESMDLQVVDLGVDVEPGRFVHAVAAAKAPILCLMGLLTVSYEHMKDTVALLEKAGLRQNTVVFIGGLVNDSVQAYVGSDYWEQDVYKACQLCKTVLKRELPSSLHIS